MVDGGDVVVQEVGPVIVGPEMPGRKSARCGPAASAVDQAFFLRGGTFLPFRAAARFLE
jgi:hypothetical protein